MAERQLNGYLWSYLAGNLGDDLLVDMLLERTHDVMWEVPLYRWNEPKEYRYEEVFENASNLRIRRQRTLRELPHIPVVSKIGRGILKAPRFDLLVSLGGSMYIEGDDWRKSIERDRGRLARLGDRGKSFVIDANFGPYQSEEYLCAYCDLFGCYEDVCFRDELSARLFPGKCRISPDAVFALNTERYKKASKGTVVSVVSYSGGRRGQYQRSYVDLLVDFVSVAPSDAFPITLMAFCNAEDDASIASQVNTRLAALGYPRCEVYGYRGNIPEAVSVIARCKYVLASRFHSMVLGLAFEKPTMTLSYSEKITNEISYLLSNGFANGSPYVVPPAEFERTRGSELWDGLLADDRLRINEDCRRAAERQFSALRCAIEEMTRGEEK